VFYFTVYYYDGCNYKQNPSTHLSGQLSLSVKYIMYCLAYPF
jgi:hypothetical protein